MPSPREAPGLWDKIVIGKVELPPAGVKGSVKAKVKNKVKDSKKSPSGTKGGRSTNLGVELAEVDIDFEFQDGPGQYDLVEAAIKKIWPPSDNAQSVTHGETALYDVRDIEIKEVEGPEWAGGKGTFKIKARQWLVPVITGGGGGAASGLDSEIAYLEAKLAALIPTDLGGFIEQQRIITRLVELKTAKAAGNSGAKTATKADPSKQWSKPGQAGGSTHTGPPPGVTNP